MIIKCDIDTFIIIEHPQEIIASFSTQEIFGREEFSTLQIIR